MNAVDIDAGILDEKIDMAEAWINNKFDDGQGGLKNESKFFQAAFSNFCDLINERAKLYLKQIEPEQTKLF